MDRATGFQRALDYIEENLEYDIDYERAARLAGVGAYHFQRIFSFMTGVTLGEYIRTRRLTLAAADIRRGMRVMDVAVKYGYESADSFARAFARFHGMPPRGPTARGAPGRLLAPAHQMDIGGWKYAGLQDRTQGAFAAVGHPQALYRRALWNEQR